MPACHGGVPKALGPTEGVIALAGNPNVGKSSLFNALTGSAAEVANYPGKTVELQWGLAVSEGRRFALVDLPGFQRRGGTTDLERAGLLQALRLQVDAPSRRLIEQP